MRFISLSAAALLGAALLVPIGTASAAGETCQGQPATIVGDPNGHVVGSEGPDVIVTNGATKVDALGGDDLICVTSPSKLVVVDAGAGDDSVLVEPGAGPTSTVLGHGADTFVAQNDQQHSVIAGSRSGDDTDPDVIRVPNAFSRVHTGAAGQPNADIIEVKAAFLHWNGTQAAPGSVRGSGGLFLSSASDAVTLDARSGTLTSSDTSLAFSGHFDEIRFTTAVERGRFTFHGTGRTEHLVVDAPTTYDRDVDMGGGESNYYQSNGLGGKHSRLASGGTRARLFLDLPTYRVRAELNRSRVTAARAGVSTAIRVRGFRDLSLSAKQAHVVGTNRSERINLLTCKAFVRARGGNDFVTIDRGSSDDWTPPVGGDWYPPKCSSYRAVVHGGSGNDTIHGSPGNDRLIGGPGKDRVEGRGGRDVCQGERVRTCERRIR